MNAGQELIDDHAVYAKWLDEQLGALSRASRDDAGGIPVPPEIADELAKIADEHVRTGKPYKRLYFMTKVFTLPPIGLTCGNCGREIESDWRNCPRCGTDFGEF